MPSDENDDPLLRLSDAVDAWLDHQVDSGDQTDEEFLEQRPELRDLLAPMVGAAQDDTAQDDTAQDDAVEASAPGLANAPRFLGDYRIVSELGRGGMGVVYEAIEESLGRRVALKVLPAHLTKSARQIERFRREAAAAARIKHPGIVPIYAVGEHDGAHFFAMEFVKGRPLGDVITSLRQKHGTFESGFEGVDVGKNLGGGYLVQVAEIVSQAAEALSAAHAEGVIHRDVKPDNIIIDHAGSIRVVDFGLAKDLERVSLSHSAEVAGTPHYMSPEQVSGLSNVGHSSDVYSLGVVLFELLSLQCPFEIDSIQGLMLAIATQTPRSLLRLSPKVPIDLQIICNTAMERSVEDRYAAIGDFAADLRRFLRHEPIVAKRPSVVTRVCKLIRRRRAATAATVLALLLPVLGVVSYFAIYRPALADEQERGAQRVAAVAKQGDDSFQRAHDLIRTNIERAEELSLQVGNEEMCSKLVADVAIAIDGLMKQSARYPSKLAILGCDYARAGIMHVRMQKTEEGLGLLNTSRRMLVKLLDEKPENLDVRGGMASVLTMRAQALIYLDRAEEAVVEGRAALAIEVELHESGEVHHLRSYPRQNTVEASLAIGLGLGKGLRDPDAAQAMFESSISICELIKPKRPIRCEISHLEALEAIAKLHLMRGWPERALDRLEEVVRVGEKSGLPGHILKYRHGIATRAIGECYDAMGKHELARASFTESIAVFRELRAGQPERQQYSRKLNASLNSLTILQARLRERGAEETGREAVLLAEELASKTSNTVITRLQLGKAYAALAVAIAPNQSLREEVLATFEKAESVQADVIRTQPEATYRYDYASTMQNHAGWLFGRRDYAAAREIAERAVHQSLKAIEVAPENPKFRLLLSLHYWLLAESELFTQDYEAAETSTQNVMELRLDKPKYFYLAAKNYARCASLAAAGPDASNPDRVEEAEQYSKAALDYLGQAGEKGVRIVIAERDPSFAQLHPRSDFKALIEEHR